MVASPDALSATGERERRRRREPMGQNQTRPATSPETPGAEQESASEAPGGGQKVLPSADVSNYYNEIDRHAAAWLRELIRAKLIPAGDVDERSILDVRPGDLAGYAQCHFFAGIAGWSHALRIAAWPDDRPVWTGSCPCQPFSAAGKSSWHGDAETFGPPVSRAHPLVPTCNDLWRAGCEQGWRLDGSLEYLLTWKERVTPAGRVICALRASGRRTSGSGFTGWPTPNTPSGGPNAKSTATHTGGMDLEGAATLAGWPTPMAGNPGTKDYNPAGNTDSSRKTTELAGWTTPRSCDGKTGHNYSDQMTGKSLSMDASLAGWNTPRATDGANGGPNQAGGALPHDAALAGWATPSSRDWKDTPGMSTTGRNPDGSERTRLDQLPRQAALASGTPTTSSPARTESRGALNPRFSLWLMGFPAEWAFYGERAMLSCRRSPLSSSVRTSKPANP